MFGIKKYYQPLSTPSSRSQKNVGEQATLNMVGIKSGWCECSLRYVIKPAYSANQGMLFAAHVRQASRSSARSSELKQFNIQLLTFCNRSQYKESCATQKLDASLLLNLSIWHLTGKSFKSMERKRYENDIASFLRLFCRMRNRG